MHKDLNPILHNQLRLKIMSLLISVESAEFTYLLDETEATRGNLSVQISKLKEAAYINVKKSFKGNYPLTSCTITQEGISAFEEYVREISNYINIRR